MLKLPPHLHTIRTSLSVMNTSRVKKNTKEELISRGTITCSLDMQNKTTATLHQPHKNIFLVRILVPLEKHIRKIQEIHN